MEIRLASSLEVLQSCGGEAETAAREDDTGRVLRIESVAARGILTNSRNSDEGKGGRSRKVKEGTTTSSASTEVQW